MSEPSTNGLCRLTVRAPDKTLDLAVPANIPVADLLPVVLTHAGDQLEEAGLDHGGWILQRIGGEPLDVEETAASLDLRDGETLLLRPRTEALPAVRYDNLLEAVSATVRDLPHAWTPQVSQWLLRLLTAAALVGCMALLATSGAAAGDRTALATGAALLTLSGASAAARVLDDVAGGVLLGLFGAAFLVLCGLLLVGGHDSGHPARAAGAHLLAAGAAGSVGLVLATTVVAAYPVVFAAGAVVAMAAVGGGALMVALDVPFTRVAATVALAAVVFGSFVPGMSFSLAGLRLPPLPTNAEQLQEGIEPRSQADVRAGSAAVDHWMTGLYGAVGLVCGACLVGLSARPGVPGMLAATLLAALMALHARSLGTSWHRLAIALPAGLGMVLLVVETARRHGTDGQLVTAAGLLAAAALCATVSWTVPGRRLLPYWGRAGDLLQSVCALALLPTALWVLGVYHRLRG